jgi:hypothetical protein
MEICSHALPLKVASVSHVARQQSKAIGIFGRDPFWCVQRASWHDPQVRVVVDKNTEVRRMRLS